MRLTLRWRIVLFTAPILAALAFASVVLVSRGIEGQIHRRLQEDLRRASAVFEAILAERSTELRVAGAVIVHDPRFFSALALPVPSDDPQYRATVNGVAQDFDRITRADLFEVLDAHGRLVSSVGRQSSSAEVREPLVRAALEGRAVEGVLPEAGAHFQAVVTPVFAGGRVVGALLLGNEVGNALASRLRELTRCEVTFVSRGHATGTTLESAQDVAAALAAAVATERARGGALEGHGEVTERFGAQTWLTRVGSIPHAARGSRDFYVVQRSVELETAFLVDIRRRLTQFGAIGALLAVLAGLAIAGRITSPLQRLVRAASEMERGNYDFPLEVRTGDEIDYLASRFDDMRRQQRELVVSLEDAARMKSEFIAVASHELRTPVSVIGGFQQLLAEGSLGPVSPGQRQALDAIQRSCSRLARLAEDATRMTQLESARDALALADADLAVVVSHAVDEARQAAPERSVDITSEIEQGLTTVLADADRLQHAISQLVRNGIRYTPDGGRVRVRVAGRDDSVEIAVEDTGVGLSPERCRSLFERGTTFRDSLNHHSSDALEFNSAGLGLGLALARRVAEAHGGSIRVESEEGRGSTFTIVLPRTAAGAHRHAA